MANPERFKCLWLFGLVAILLFSCNNKQAKPATYRPKAEEHEHNLKAPDTTTLLWHISTGKERELSALSKRNHKEYARTILKQFAFCNCIYQAFRNDSVFFATDNSNGFLSREMVAHSPDVVDSISKVVKTYVTSMHNAFEPASARPVSLFCMDLYESAFLDSLVKHYDSKITKELNTQ